MSGALQDEGQDRLGRLTEVAPEAAARRGVSSGTAPEQARAGISAAAQRALEELSAGVEDALAYVLARTTAQEPPERGASAAGRGGGCVAARDDISTQ